MSLSLAAFLRRYLSPLRVQVALLAALLLTGVAIHLLNPQIVRTFIDTAQAGGTPAALAAAATAFLLVALAGQVVNAAETFVAGNIGWRATNALRADLVAHCLSLDQSFHNAHMPGELIERVDGDVSQLAGFFSRFVVVILGNTLLLVGVLLLMAREDWRIGGFFALMSVVRVLVATSTRRLQSRLALAQRQASATLLGYLEELLNALPDVKANGGQAYVLWRAERLLRDLYQRAKKAVLIAVLLDARRLVGTADLVVLFVASASLYRSGELSLGTVYLLFAYRSLLGQPISQITRQIGEFQQASASLGRVRELLAIQPAIVDAGRVALPAGPLAVSLREVRFAYGAAASRPALRNVYFEVAPGAVLGLLGRTGSGKTTITRLLFRMVEAQRGNVLLGGVDVRDVPLDQLRERVGLVTQEVQLFRASVRDNVALFDPAVSDAHVERALHEVGLGDRLAGLPHGLDTRLGVAGSGLSAGEAQLLAFARVFLRDPGLVILDEATARIDPVTERRVQRAIDRLLAGRTGIVIAHRLETVECADEILILEDGGVAEHGPRAALAADPTSRFAALLRSGALVTPSSEPREQLVEVGR